MERGWLVSKIESMVNDERNELLIANRRLLVEMARRRVRPGSGSSRQFLLRRTAMQQWPDLRSILADIPWVIVGGVATRAYMPERATQALDILVREQDGEQVRQQLERAGYQFQTHLGIAGYLLCTPDQVEIDVLLGHEAWVEEALAKPEVDPAGYPVSALPYLVLMKMAASRGQDIGDLSIMLGLADNESLSRVRQTVARYAPADSDDLESLIFIGRQQLTG